MVGTAPGNDSKRRVRRLETDWRFRRGDPAEAADPEFDDSEWEAVSVPHDWSIEGPFDPDNPGGEQQGFAPGGVAWYRRELPEDLDAKQIYVRFGGVYRNSEVYVDGERVGARPNGYVSFQYDVSQCSGGETIAVRVDNDQYPHSRWYTGSGVYRDVEVIETAPVHVRPWGTDVRTQAVTDGRAEIAITTALRNASPMDATGQVVTEVLDPDGELVSAAERSFAIDADAETTVDQRVTIADPRRWSIEDPERYRLRTLVYRDSGDSRSSAAGEPADASVTPFGIRTFEWTADSGFFLNGQSVTLQGVNLHHDAGCLGAAVPRRALERRLETLQEMGCNAIRTAHNPPQRALLELADRMGFVVVEEAFDKWRHEGAERFFDDWWQRDLAEMIRRDRNHPSIVAWSVGNESYDQGDDRMVEDLAMLAEATNELDPTRPVTYGNPMWGDDADDILENLLKTAEHVDLVSCNYGEPWYDDLHEQVGKPIVGSECRPYFRGTKADPVAFVPRNPWFDVVENEYVAGQFIWAGVDYLGEARAWPSRGWATGLIDTSGEPKPEAGFHRSVWTDDPLVTIAVRDDDLDRPAGRPNWSWPPLADHWTFPDRGGAREFVHVYTFTNVETVDLYLNDERIGTQRLSNNPDRVIEWEVPYESGQLRAEARVDGEVQATDAVRTAGDPAAVSLSLDRESIEADGRDLVYATAAVVDADGVVVPGADHEVTFDVSGAGTIVGVDNGNLDSTESYTGTCRSAYRGTCVAVVQAARTQGALEIAADASNVAGDSHSITVETSE
ncbi:MAG: glycoside hydrolase family 2 TIM barrel-domain containing protein [Halodesulfurarchaeum sp.]